MRTLYHWSRKSLDIFSSEDPKFKVKTQGHAYALDSLDNKSGATSRFEAKSLIVFTEQAAELFEKHPFMTAPLLPLVTIMFWKRLYKQFWSKKFLYDLRWDASDSFRCGEVIVIRRAEPVPVMEWRRILDQLVRRGTIFAIDLFLWGLIIDVMISANSDWGIIRNFSPEVGINPLTGTKVVVVALIVVGTTMCLMRVRKAKDADGTEWDYRRELECAMRQAEEARLREEVSRASNSEK